MRGVDVVTWAALHVSRHSKVAYFRVQRSFSNACGDDLFSRSGRVPVTVSCLNGPTLNMRKNETAADFGRLRGAPPVPRHQRARARRGCSREHRAAASQYDCSASASGEHDRRARTNRACRDLRIFGGYKLDRLIVGLGFLPLAVGSAAGSSRRAPTRAASVRGSSPAFKCSACSDQTARFGRFSAACAT